MNYGAGNGEDSLRGTFNRGSNLCSGCRQSGTMMYVIHGRRYHDGCGPVTGNNPLSGMVSYASGLLNGIRNIIKRPTLPYGEPEPSEDSRTLREIFGPELRIVKSKHKKG